MNPISTLTLTTPNGAFVFQGAEVPEKITFGGAQLLNVEKMIGGRRRINAMGADDAPLEWTGWFLYSSALSRARFLDSVRREGLACTLSWDALLYQVVIAEFHADYEKPFKIPYQIRFEVIEDETATVDSVPAVTPAQSMMLDMARMNVLSACLGNSALNGVVSDLNGAMASLNSALQPIANGLKAVLPFVAGVSNCATQVVNTVEPVLQLVAPKLAAVGLQVQTMTSLATHTLGLGTGVVPGASPFQMTSGVAAATGAGGQLPDLYEMSSLIARMQVNLPLASTQSSAKTITVGGGDLFTIASQQYGDASRWTDIAAANNITDPVLTGINTLTIPA